MIGAMLLADARLPTGGHAYSAGVEPALRGGLEPGRVREYMIGRATTCSLVEAGTAVVARAFAEAGREPGPVLAAWAARTPAPALRAASIAQGRGYLRLARTLWPSSPVLDVLARTPRPLCRAVVVGTMAVPLGIEPADLARLAVYDDAACAAAALLKLEPRDPAEVTGWIMAACAAAEPQVTALAALTEPAAIPAAGAPQTEEWAQAHAAMTQRLFRA